MWSINRVKTLAVVLLLGCVCVAAAAPNAVIDPKGLALALSTAERQSSDDTVGYVGSTSEGLVFAPLRLSGPGGNRIGIQAFTIDERSRNIYTLQLSGAGSGNKSTVNRLPLDGEVGRSSVGYSTPVSYDVGHQGLGIEYLVGGDFRLWSTGYKDFRQAVRYAYADGRPLDNVESYGLFGNEFRRRSSSTPTISHDQRYLIAVGMRKHASDVTVRIWRLADLTNGGPGDYSQSWLYEWDTHGLTDSLHPTQGIASDGKTVWLLSGNNDVGLLKRLQAYTLRGSLISTNGRFQIGRAQALLEGAGSIYEPEGLALFFDEGRLKLCVGILSGDLGARRARIYEIRAY